MTLEEILNDRVLANEDKAKQCIAWVSDGDVSDPRVDGYLAASQTFALLAIADALTTGSGHGIADIVDAQS